MKINKNRVLGLYFYFNIFSISSLFKGSTTIYEASMNLYLSVGNFFIKSSYIDSPILSIPSSPFSSTL